jgi:hypothetical protein
MAIKNENGNYLKITRIDDSDLSRTTVMVSWELWLNTDIRYTPTEFDKPKNGNSILLSLNDKLNVNANNKISIKDNRIKAAYSALKEMDEYSNWIDC